MEHVQIMLNVIIFIILPLVIYTTRNWIKTYITSGVKHDFEVKLESLCSELRTKENQIVALQDSVLTGRATREALLDKRRLKAIEHVWDAFVDLGAYKPVAAMMSPLEENASFQQSNDPEVQKFFQTISGLAPELKKPDRLIDKEKLFISPLAWAYFQAYRSVIISIYLNAKILGFGLSDGQKYIKKTPLKDLLRKALPHQNEFMEKSDTHAYYHLLDELEAMLQNELLKGLDGGTQDSENVNKAAGILAEVNKVNASLSKDSKESSDAVTA